MALQDYLVDFCMLDKRTVEDGYGGVEETWIDGAHFMAGLTTKQSTQAQIAYQQGLKTMYKLVFKPTVALKNGDKVKRVSDGLVLKITSNSRDMTTPAPAQLKMSEVTAEVIEP